MDATAQRLLQRGSPFELQDVLINGIPCKVFPRGPQTLLELFRKATAFPQRECLIFDEARITVGELTQTATSIARSLQSQFAADSGMRVAIIMRNRAEWAAAFMAIAALGATTVAIHAENQAEEILAALTDAQCMLAVCDRHAACLLTELAWQGGLLVIDETNHGSSNESTYEHGSGNSMALPFLGVPAAPDAEALITFTSGTTGRAKGIVLSHRNLVTGMMNMMLGGTLTALRSAVRPAISSGAPCTMVLAPLSYIGGYAQLLLMLYLGGKIVLPQERNAPAVARLIAQERIKSISGASPALLAELASMDQTQHDLSSLNHLSVFGSALQGELKDILTSSLPHVTLTTGYGMTETCGSVCISSGVEFAQHPLSSGVILPSVELRIVNAHGMDRPAGEVGEIWIRGAMVMQRYLGQSASESPHDAWFRTGDLGRLDADNRLYVLDRIKNVVSWHGAFISATETEAAARSCAHVTDAAVVGIAATDTGLELVIAITPHDLSDYILAGLEKTIISQSSAGLPRLRLISCAALPRTVSGKIRREALRQQLAHSLPQLNFQ